MRYLSLFSGIEAATVAWQHMGWESLGLSEIEPFPCALLKHYYPGVPNLGDVSKITEAQIKALGQIDLIVFGFPCQDVSGAGKRKGFEDEDGNRTRSGLFHEAIRIIRCAKRHCGLRYALLENVPGLLSARAGADFATVVEEMVGATARPPHKWKKEGCAVGPYGMLEWSVLDARWFGVAQRRKRVFAIADFGDWAGRPPILLESSRLRRDCPKGREEREDVAPTISARTKGGGGLGTDFDLDGGLIAAFGGNNQSGPIETATAVNACSSSSGRLDFESETFIAHTLRGEGFDASEDGTGRGTPIVPVAFNSRVDFESETFIAFTPEVAGTLKSCGGKSGSPNGAEEADRLIAFDTTQITSKMNYSNPQPGDPCHPLAATAHVPAIAGLAVRRLTPRECERLQGFPDGYTLIPKAKDSPRYKALGNLMAVPCMRWIGHQILKSKLYEHRA